MSRRTELLRGALLIGAALGCLDAALTNQSAPLTVGSPMDAFVMLALACTTWILALLLSAALVSTFTTGVLKWSAGDHRWKTSILTGLLVALPIGFPLVDDLWAHDLLKINKDLARGLVVALGFAIGAGWVLLARHPASMALFALGTLICGGMGLRFAGRGDERGDTNQQNVVLISLDTLRADHLGTYGYERATSPNIDALAKQAVVFDNAISASHWTLPSHAALLTGMNPVALGILRQEDYLDAEYHTLAETLYEAGWNTAAFVGLPPSGFVGSRRGFDQGFDTYNHPPYSYAGMQSATLRGLSSLWQKKVMHEVGTASSQITHVERWLESRPEGPFFLFLHLFDIHSDSNKLPYETPGDFQDRFTSEVGADLTGCHPSGLCASELLVAYANGDVEVDLSEDQIQRMIDLYDGGIAYADSQIQRVIEALDRQGLTESTTIILTSDHGESFFEHGVPLHCDLHRENLHVPLIIKAPGLEPRRVQQVVQNMDVAPTVLQLLGFEASERSLLQVVHGASTPRSAMSASEKQLAWTRQQDKLILEWDGRTEETINSENPQYFDSTNDLAEQRPLPREQAAQVLELLLNATGLSLVLRDSILPSDERGTLELSAEQRSALDALGYTQGAEDDEK